MPIGEIIAETVLAPIVEVILLGTSYVVGYITVTVCSLGKIEPGSFSLHTSRKRKKKSKSRDKQKKKWYHIEIFDKKRRKGRKVMSSDAVSVIGILVIVTGFLIYFY